MADHVRKQLRDAAILALQGLPLTGSRVYASRAHPITASELPCLVVYAASEAASAATIPGDLRRAVTLRVEGYARSGADLDDALDEIARDVEIALAGPLTVAGVAVLISYDGAEMRLDDSTDLDCGVVELTFTAELFTAAGIPDALILA